MGAHHWPKDMPIPAPGQVISYRAEIEARARNEERDAAHARALEAQRESTAKLVAARTAGRAEGLRERAQRDYMQGFTWGATCGALAVALVMLAGIGLGVARGWFA